jgi:CRP-like cAMP-binding protein
VSASGLFVGPAEANGERFLGKNDELRKLLSESDLFYPLSEEDLADLVSIAITRKVSRGETIFVAGEPGRQLFAVCRGRVKAVATAADGREMVLRLVDPGEVFGELALLDGGERTATLIAAQPSELLVIDRRDFVSLLRRRPEIAIELLAVVAGRLRSTTEQVRDTNFLEIGPRLAKKVLELANLYAEQSLEGEVLEVSQEELGMFIAATRVSVNMQLKVWERAGLLRTARGKIFICDKTRLAEVARSE